MSSSYEFSSKNARATSEMRNLRGSSEVNIENLFMLFMAHHNYIPINRFQMSFTLL